ncbi:hypothetical protein HDU92_008030 [Lobulomyces angularis]|nr:hypothetical protein HDU92_008030 [Lobulomyces angularis]
MTSNQRFEEVFNKHQEQGLPIKVPPSIVDVENYLKKSGPILETNSSTAQEQQNGPPMLPTILNNKMIIPECENISNYERTKTLKTEMPLFQHPVYPKGIHQTNIMVSGRDTRLEVRDNYKPINMKYTIPVKNEINNKVLIGGGTSIYNLQYPCKSVCNQFNQCKNLDCVSKFHVT